MKRCILPSLLCSTAFIGSVHAQVEHRVHLLDGTVIAHPTTAIDSIVFDQSGTTLMRIHLLNGTQADVLVAEIDSADFAPLTTWTFEDPRDGNEYDAMMIGDQCWMVENLRYLPAVVGGNVGSTATPRYYVHGYTGMDVAAAMASPAYGTYGVLYNWPAAMQGAASSSTNPSGVQGICPDGWHLPSDEEMKQLEIFLGLSVAQANNTGYRGSSQGSRLAGNAALWTPEALTAHALFGTSGFDAIPGSVRSLGAFGLTIGEQSAWWTATEQTGTTAWYRNVQYTQTGVLRNHIEREYGMSVRCVCDQ